MLSYDDPKWKELKGSRGTLYNPTVTLQKLERGEKVEKAWEELWDELHHQGDGLKKLGAFITTVDESELNEYVEEHLAWSVVYR